MWTLSGAVRHFLRRRTPQGREWRIVLNPAAPNVLFYRGLLPL
jgi:hypothetical protein